LSSHTFYFGIFHTNQINTFSGYSCEDHFYESDTFLHSWEVLLQIMMSPICQNMLVDVGMPVQHFNVAYNCRVIFYNKKIILIRPKMMMCDDGEETEPFFILSYLH
jgi:NAD+ synthase (glutamine-hydrolysing)